MASLLACVLTRIVYMSMINLTLAISYRSGMANLLM